MALTEIYVDPSIAADSGTGTIGDPFGDLEYAIEQTTFDTTNGTRVNIKAGTDEVLVADIATAMADTSVSVAWAPSITANCVFQGYSVAAGDLAGTGTMAGISGGGLVSIYSSAVFDHVAFIDLHLHNVGNNTALDMDDWCSVIRCEVDNGISFGIRMDQNAVVLDCYVHNFQSIGIDILGGMIAHNYLENGTASFSNAINCTTGFIFRNIVKVSGGSGGILFGINCVIAENSVFSDGGTSSGILPNATNKIMLGVMNNVVEGFSGTGGVGFDFSQFSGQKIRAYCGNSAYNNTTDYAAPSILLDDYAGSNETLTASPFTDAINGDFSPVDTGSIKEGSVPTGFGNGQ